VQVQARVHRSVIAAAKGPGAVTKSLSGILATRGSQL
jgi:hypothetical protein